MMPLAIGCKVYLPLDRPPHDSKPGWNESMDKYLGKQVTITNIGSCSWGIKIKIKEDSGIWLWKKEWFLTDPEEPSQANLSRIIKKTRKLEAEFKLRQQQKKETLCV